MAVAFELEDGVDDVLEDFRASEGAFFVDVAKVFGMGGATGWDDYLCFLA